MKEARRGGGPISGDDQMVGVGSPEPGMGVGREVGFGWEREKGFCSAESRTAGGEMRRGSERA